MQSAPVIDVLYHFGSSFVTVGEEPPAYVFIGYDDRGEDGLNAVASPAPLFKNFPHMLIQLLLGVGSL